MVRLRGILGEDTSAIFTRSGIRDCDDLDVVVLVREIETERIAEKGVLLVAEKRTAAGGRRKVEL